MSSRKKSKGTSPQKMQNIAKPSRKDVSGTSDVKARTMAIHRTFSSGPMPPPDMLDHYKSVDPRLPARMMSMAEKRQKHSQELEKIAMEAAINAERRGQRYALIASGVMITLSAYLIDAGHTLHGSFFAGSTVIGLAYVFIVGRKPKKKPPQSS